MEPESKQLTVSNASSSGTTELLENLLEQGSPANTGNTQRWQPLFYAIHGNHYLCAKILLQRQNVNINYQAAYGVTPLHVACRGDSPLQMIQLLLANGANINAMNNHGHTPLCEVLLHSACKSSVQLLLTFGANLKMEMNHRDSPFHIAVRKDQHDLARMLVDAGADPNACQLITPPLCITARSGSLETMKLLVNEFHCNVNISDLTGTTALYEAVYRKHLSCIEFLLDNKADVNISNDSGFVPLHVAIENNLVDVIKMLVKHTDLRMIIPQIKIGDCKARSFLCMAIERARPLLTVLQLLLTNCDDPDAHVHHIVNSFHRNFFTLVNPNDSMYFRAKKFLKFFNFAYDNYKYYTPLSYLLEHSKDANIYEAACLLIDKGSSVNMIKPCYRPPLIALVHNGHLARNDFTTFKKLFMLLVDNNVDMEYQSSCERRPSFMDGPDALSLTCFLSEEALMLFMSYSRFTVFELLQMWRKIVRSMMNAEIEELIHFNSNAQKCNPIIVRACAEMCGSDLCHRKLWKLIHVSHSTVFKVENSDINPLFRPKTLQHMCRYRIREELSLNSPKELSLWAAVDELILPTALKKYLLYKD